MPEAWPDAASRAIVITEIEAMGGAERSVLALARWLAEHNLPHHVLTYEDRLGLAAHATAPLTVVQLKPTMRAAKKIAALRRYFAARRAGPRPLMSGYQPALHGSLAGLRGFHCLMHDTPSLFEADAARRGVRALSRYAADLVTGIGLRSGGQTMVTSEYLRDECSRVFGVEAAIARMGGLHEANAFRPRSIDRELRLLSVSRVEGNKRVDWLLRALAALEHEATPLSQRVEWRLDVVGKGSQLESMQRLAEQLNLRGRVHFRGFVSDTELHVLYDEAHLFLMPAVQGYGIPAIEALGRGLPVLLHRDSGVSDILRDTPWATVIEGGEENLLPGLRHALQFVIGGTQAGVPLPQLPTENEWAERVARLCDWV